MPVIVIGADTTAGESIIDALNHGGREVRAFVSDESRAAELRKRGVKVALGDVSDDSHVETASMWCFSAVLVTEAALDDRERSFASTPDQVLAGWARAVSASKVKRALWISDQEVPETKVSESTTLDPAIPDLASTVAALDDAQSI